MNRLSPLATRASQITLDSSPVAPPEDVDAAIADVREELGFRELEAATAQATADLALSRAEDALAAVDVLIPGGSTPTTEPAPTLELVGIDAATGLSLRSRGEHLAMPAQGPLLPAGDLAGQLGSLAGAVAGAAAAAVTEGELATGANGSLVAGLALPAAAAPVQAQAAAAPTAATPADGDYSQIVQGGVLKKVLHRLLTASWLGGLAGELARTLSAHLLDQRLSVKSFGAKGDLRTAVGGIGAGGTTWTATTPVFAPADTGKRLIATGAGAAGAFLVATLTYLSATTVSLSAAAATPVSDVAFWFGTDDSDSFARCIAFAWNGGSPRAAVVAPPSDYLISDPDGDGYGVVVPDGVHFAGHGYGTALHCFTPIRAFQYDGLAGGTWKKGVARDFLVDGHDVARTGLHLHSGAYYSARDILVKNCVDAIAVDGSQNIHLLNVQARDSTTSWKVLNGAGSVILEGCGAWFAGLRHILLDNDAAYPGWAQRPSQGGMAYDDPTIIVFRGGVYEAARPGSTLSECMKVVRGAAVIFEDANLSGSPSNALLEHGVAATGLTMRTPYLYHGSATCDVVHLLGFGASLYDPQIVAAGGDLILVGNYCSILRPNGTPLPGRVMVKPASGSPYSSSSQVRYESLRAGGGTASRPAANEATNVVLHRYNYDTLNPEFFDPLVNWWRVVGFSDYPTLATVPAGGTYTPDLTAGRHFHLTASGGDLTIADPINGQIGDRWGVTVVQDGVGGRVVGWGPGVKQAWSDAGNAAGKRSTIQFRCAAAGVHDQVAAQGPYIG